MLKRLTLLAGVGLALAACQEDASPSRSARHYTPVPPQTVALMESKGMARNAPVLIRSYKKEAELEVWKQTKSGKYALLKTFPICRWSGQLGPKVREGDRQAPEGFYAITPAQMNPNSNYYLSFNMGYPNAFDRAYGRTGSYLMVHGACSSAGCYSMTDDQIAELYALVRDAHAGGQKAVQMQAMPFRMTPENMAKHRLDPNIAFWRNLKEGSDHFEVTKEEPKVAVCGKRYVFNASAASGALDPAGACPPLTTDPEVAQAVTQKEREDNARIAELVERGTPAIKLVYADGGQHQSFRVSSLAPASDRDSSPVQTWRSRIADVSRPEALEAGPQEVELDAAGKPRVVAPKAEPTRPEPAKPAVAVASVAPLKPANAAPAASVTSGEDRPFFKRVLSFGGLFGSEETKAVPTIELATPQPTTAPVPPRRQPTPLVKPQAAAPAGITTAQVVN
ncbi:L,D-transpeptidase family protein [Chelatococcus sp. SYSU_G07232]|uniref:L,D-transpeptidase family protein n=1 Tax=Chelatococcus albus TaxID=3047466 RepID=A0ABT7AFR1_9HYPH|nr:L,D-transpeptidase family protein [Chelatococcus sp. SYSU_G07232]MDJ1157466.1 L,D-transpeptidase family protein [Chelatococcus sp. SYSU_G07232]